MMNADPLLKILRNPCDTDGFTLADWDLLVRQGRATNLMARLAVKFEEAGCLDAIPQRPRAHFDSALILGKKHFQDICWEIQCLEKTLAGLNMPVILLKGAAYVAANLPSAKGRLFSDVDIMVPRESLAEVEKTLMKNGWISTHHDAYDQRYYRTWMHELPPLQHIGRKTVLDVHHNILPLTAKHHPDAEKLRQDARPVRSGGQIMVLSPTDMIIHSATHLFSDGEMEQGLRDLVDLDAMLRQFASEAGFWESLLERAQNLCLSQPLYYGLYYASELLRTPVPVYIIEMNNKAAPAWPASFVMKYLLDLALAPNHPSCDRPLTGLARWLLFLRAHALRMPLYLLIPHLLRKALRRYSAAEE